MGYALVGNLYQCCVELIRNGAETDVVNKSGMKLDELAQRRGLSLEELHRLATI